MPEERSEKSNHNNAKDKTPHFENRGGLVARGQPVGIAHAKLSVARQQATSPDIDKDLLNPSGSRRCSGAPQAGRQMRLSYG